MDDEHTRNRRRFERLMSIYEKGLTTVLACNALFCLLSVPLILRRIPPNPIYGYRTRLTLGDPGIWYEANAHFGKRFLAASIGAAAAFVLFTRLVPTTPDVFLPISVVAMGLPVLLAGVSTTRLVRRLEQATAGRP